MFGIPAYYYPFIYLTFIAIMSLYVIIMVFNADTDTIINKRKGWVVPVLVCIFLMFFLGFRPVSGLFGDMKDYHILYQNIASGFIPPQENDMLFRNLMTWFAHHYDSKYFFFTVACLYIIPHLLACFKLSRENASPIFIFMISAMSFYGYATNGIRSGVAASLFVLAITFLRGDYKNKIIYGLLCMASYGFHNSMALPIAASIAAYFIKNPKLMFYFWGASIVISLYAGEMVSDILSGLGLDARLEGYLSGSSNYMSKLKEGFRWDFLLYSFIPVLMGWYAIFRLKIYTRTYAILLGTYIYANAFWIMVIRAPYSNRFAYLSWCIYPMVLAYPMFELPFWKDKPGMKASMVLAGHFLFTLIIFLKF